MRPPDTETGIHTPPETDLGQDPAESPAKETDPLSFDRRKALRAWKTLWPDERHDVMEWLRLEVSVQDTFQRKLMRYVLERATEDPGLYPLAEPAPLFDPERHAPKQPIARRRMGPEDPQTRRWLQRFDLEPDPDAMRPAWRYDWARRTVVRVPLSAGVDDPDAAVESERLFHNALLGLPPELDLVTALVEATLDDGAEAPTLQAFAHAYADRSGRVAPGITLYDVWGSGKTFETPDVETLGIVHTVLGPSRKWKAPVPASKQRKLYAQVGELYQNARRYRGLRQALADLYARSAPPNRDGYEGNRSRLHAAWEQAAAEPERLGPKLPGVKRWERWLLDLDKRVSRDEELAAVANSREWTLAQDEERVQRTLMWVLREYGALDRRKRPKRRSSDESKSSGPQTGPGPLRRAPKSPR